jgi:hypothetical protein
MAAIRPWISAASGIVTGVILLLTDLRGRLHLQPPSLQDVT